MTDSGTELRRMIVEWRARYRWRKNFNEPLIIPGAAAGKGSRQRPAVRLQVLRWPARSCAAPNRARH